MHVRRDDMVLVTAGKNRGKTGKIQRVLPEENRVVVEGVNLIKRHLKRRTQTGPAGTIEREAPFHASNVMLLCPKCNQPARTGHRFLADGTKVRYCKRCQETIE
ncbi:MAG: 50S ribosomal protein L24 [Chloroflexi bacterium]|nr:50S ribosomal protein L24 [Chloroflexota bacterium]